MIADIGFMTVEKVRQNNRVVYDITVKPPATTEYVFESVTILATENFPDKVAYWKWLFEKN